MDEYPNSDEEFELRYDEELELLRDEEPEEEQNVIRRPKIAPAIPANSQTPQTSTDNDTDIPQTQINIQEEQPESILHQFSPLTIDRNEPSTSSNYNNSSTNFDTNFTDSAVQNNNNKRTIQELFGDIDDILYEHQNVAKKCKKDDKNSADLALIDYLVELRKEAKERANPILTKRDYTAAQARNRNNLSCTVPRYPFIAVTRHDGSRVYVRFHSEEYEKEEMRRVTKEIVGVGNLMGEGFKEVWENARKLINQELDGSSTNPDSEVLPLDAPAPTEQTTKLWVDLYKPRKYLELLSDESTNRIMLKWMKLWDKCVFNRRPKVKIPKNQDGAAGAASVQSKWAKKQELSTDLDEHGRPQHKVALLCGPPGLGKTTLAHMVARHAGYNVVEVNASDDRSTDSFKRALENATQMRSVIDRDRRPNCLVFDEIDGAPQSSIDYLVKFITGTASSKKKGANKDKSQSHGVLKRPIICICNDVYVPALRPLRQIAFVVNFPATSSVRLSERLMEIARRQQVKTDLGAMLALAEKSQNDIRSCLSVLHFFKAQNKAVTLSDIYKVSVGQKDMQKGLFAVWQDIFQIERPKIRNMGDPASGAEAAAGQDVLNLKKRAQKVLQVVNSFGDYSRLTQGVFENYPQMKIKDSTMEGTCNALEWFCFTDILNQQIYSQQDYTLTSYLQFGFVVWHFTFASTSWQKLQYPSVGYEVRTKQTRQQAIVNELIRGMQASVRAFLQPQNLILDVLPLLSLIIVPNFRPVTLHLFTQEERRDLERVVNIMVDYNLNYVQERTPEGTYIYKLDPDIEEIVTFSGDEAASQQRNVSYFNKQLIAKEIEICKMHRAEMQHKMATAQQNEKRLAQKSAGNATTSAGLNLPNHLQTLQPINIKAKIKPKIAILITATGFLPYIDGCTDRIGRILKQNNIKVIFSPSQKISTFFPKNKEPKKKLEGPVVYSIPCSCGKAYIGQTGRNIRTRLREHVSDTKRNDERSAVVEHSMGSGHAINFNGTKTLARVRHFWSRMFREAIEIQKEPENINRDLGINIAVSWKQSSPSPIALIAMLRRTGTPITIMADYD